MVVLYRIHKVNSNIFELSKREIVIRCGRHLWRGSEGECGVWTERSAKLRNGGDGARRRRGGGGEELKGSGALVGVCINAQSGEQTVRPAETQFAGKSSKSRGWLRVRKWSVVLFRPSSSTLRRSLVHLVFAGDRTTAEYTFEDSRKFTI